MAGNTNISIDPVVKEEAQALFDNLGMSLSGAVNIFLKQCVREQAIPFRIGEPVPNAVTLAAMKDAAAGRNLYGPFDSVAAAMEALNAED